MGQPRPLFRLFSVFSNKHYKFLQQIYVKRCPYSIWCWDSNPRPLERESPPITTKPGLPPQIKVARHISHPPSAFMLVKIHQQFFNGFVELMDTIYPNFCLLMQRIFSLQPFDVLVETGKARVINSSLYLINRTSLSVMCLVDRGAYANL